MNKLQTLFFSIIISLAVAGIVFAFTNPSGNPPIGGGTIGVGSNAPVNSLYIKSDGNVGIGMTGPVYKLDVNGSFNATSLYISGVLKNTVWDAKESGIATGTTAQYWRGDKTWQTLTGTLPSGTSGQTLRHDGTNWVANSILSNDGTKITINGTVDNLLTLSRSGAASSTVFKLGTDSALIVNSGGSDVLTLKGGNVGIGDTTPTSLLTVGSGDLFQVDSSGNIVKIRNIAYSWPSTQGAANTFLQNNGSGTLSWVVAGAGGVSSVSNSDGTLTISPTTGAVVASLNLAHANTWTGSQTFSANTNFPGSGIWNTSGNVGIGTATPYSKLQVAGGVQIGNDTSTCNATKAGTLRYNAGKAEYCNGSQWKDLATPTTTFAVCSDGGAQGFCVNAYCSCTGGTRISYTQTGYCTVTSDTGSCSASGSTYCDATCCVCRP